MYIICGSAFEIKRLSAILNTNFFFGSVGKTSFASSLSKKLVLPQRILQLKYSMIPAGEPRGAKDLAFLKKTGEK